MHLWGLNQALIAQWGKQRLKTTGITLQLHLRLWETYVVVFSSRLCGVLLYRLYSAITVNPKKQNKPAVVHTVRSVGRSVAPVGSVFAFSSALALNQLEVWCDVELSVLLCSSSRSNPENKSQITTAKPSSTFVHLSLFLDLPKCAKKFTTKVLCWCDRKNPQITM